MLTDPFPTTLQNAWDQYIQNSQMEPIMGDMQWPSGFDMAGTGAMDTSITGDMSNGGQQQGTTQLNANLFANNPALLPPGTTL